MNEKHVYIAMEEDRTILGVSEDEEIANELAERWARYQSDMPHRVDGLRTMWVCSITGKKLCSVFKRLLI